MSTFVEELISNNEAPILFIGSGISKRYLKNSPDWQALLKDFYKSAGFSNDYFGQLNNIKRDISEELGESEKDFKANIKMATIISDRYVDGFNEGTITINGFTPEDSYKEKICPFKMGVANVFENLEEKVEMSEEIKSFRNLIRKSQFIITTNYDEFIEKTYQEDESGEKLIKYIGARGFFSQSYDISEIYKIHGCVKSPNDIIITERDYKEFRNKEVLVSAKIVSMLMENPIMFLGYSLTDLNIRNIIKNVSAALTDEELIVFSNKVAIVEWSDGENNLIEEIISDRDLGCSLRRIRTDNFKLLFKELSKINQGMPLSIVRKFKSKIKNLIDDRAREGALETVLIAEKELDEIDISKEKNLVVALGSDKLVFQLPNNIVYCIDYISESNEIPVEIQLRFLSMQNSRARFPVNRILKNHVIEKSQLHPEEKEKLKQRIKEASNFDLHHKSISRSQVYMENANDLEEILREGKGETKIFETIASNIEAMDLDEVKEYILKNLEEFKNKGKKLTTSFRKLLLLYDIVKCKRDNAKPY